MSEEKAVFYDITRTVRTGVPVWPGDTAFAFRLGWDMATGASVNVGTVTMSVHTGTHADAPFHFDSGGTRAGEMDLLPFLGPAIVVDVTGLDPIPWNVLETIDFARTPRLLLKTGAWTDPERFPEFVPTLAADVPMRLGGAGVLLVGLDVPSVDRLDSVDLPVHHALNRAGVRILESLDLSDVTPGVYHLTALPLKLMEADGTPIRAVLTTAGTVSFADA